MERRIFVGFAPRNGCGRMHICVVGGLDIYTVTTIHLIVTIYDGVYIKYIQCICIPTCVRTAYLQSSMSV